MQTSESALQLRKTWPSFIYDIVQLAVILALPMMFVTLMYWFDISSFIPKHGAFAAHRDEVLLWVFLLIIVLFLLWLMSMTLSRRLAGRPDIVISPSGIEMGFWRSDHRSWDALGDAVITMHPSGRGFWRKAVKIPGAEQTRIVGTDIIILDSYGLSPASMIEEIDRIRSLPNAASITMKSHSAYRDQQSRYSAWSFAIMVAALIAWLQFGQILLG